MALIAHLNAKLKGIGQGAPTTTAPAIMWQVTFLLSDTSRFCLTCVTLFNFVSLQLTCVTVFHYIEQKKISFYNFSLLSFVTRS